MWGSFPVPCAAIYYRRCIPCNNPSYSYGRASLPPSEITPVSIKNKSNDKKKKKTMVKKHNANTKKSAKPEKTIAPAFISSTYAGSEGGYVTRSLPKSRTKKKRPATAGAGGTPKQPMKDFSPSRYNTESSVYCGIGGVYKIDATTATDIKTNTSTSTNNLDFFCSMQKAVSGCTQRDIRSNQQYNQSIQDQYNLALQQQWLNKCFYCQALSQQNPSGFNNPSTSQVPQRSIPQSVTQLQNSFQQSIQPCTPFFNGSFPCPSNQSVLPCQIMNMSWPSAGCPKHLAHPPYVQHMSKKCETCGRLGCNKR